MRPLLPLVLALVLAGPAGDARAGAWLQEPGAGYFKISGLYSAADRRLDCDGAHAPAEPFGGTWRELDLLAYAEYGLHPRVTLVGSFGAGRQEIHDAEVPDYGTTSTGDLQLGARWGLVRNPARPVSLQTLVALPTYPFTDPTLPVGQREQFLPAGTGKVQVEAVLQAGASLWPLPLYTSAEAGYRARGAPFGDQWVAAVEVGGSAPRFFAKLELRAAWPAGGECSEGQTSAGSVSIEERSVRLGPEAAVRVLGRWWAGVTWTTLLNGRNTLDNDQFLLFVAWTLPGRDR